MDTVKTVISKSKKVDKATGRQMQQVVYLTEAGKNKKGKTIYESRTKHETIY